MRSSLLAFLLAFAPQYTVPSHTGATAASGGQTWAFVQAASGESGSNNPTLAFSTNNTAGNAIIACVGLYNATIGATISDSRNTYNTLISFSNAGGSVYRAVALNIGAGANTVTFTVPVVFDAVYTITEYSGIATSSAIDQTQGGINTTTTSWTSGATGSNTGQTNELGIGFCTYQNNLGNDGVFSQGSGWTSRSTQQGGAAWGSIVEDMNLATLTTYAATATTTLTNTGRDHV